MKKWTQVDEIIKLTFQNLVEQTVTKFNDHISPFVDSKHSGRGDAGANTQGSGDNDVYVVDYANIRVQKFNNQGDFTSKWGTKGKADRRFEVPHGIVVDKKGNVCVVDMDNNKVQKFDINSEFLLE